MRKIALAGLLAREQVASCVQHAADFCVLFVSSVLSLAILRTWPTRSPKRSLVFHDKVEGFEGLQAHVPVPKHLVAVFYPLDLQRWKRLPMLVGRHVMPE